MVNINTGTGSGGGGGGSNIQLSREDLGLDDSGGSGGSSDRDTRQQDRDPFEGAQTGSDVFQPGQTINRSRRTANGDTSGTSDADGGGSGGGVTQEQQQDINQQFRNAEARGAFREQAAQQLGV
ncbi:MAG: hypothetical protein ACNS61_11900, partial [Candidatus Wenzhouxiangella sp. M2_3B_020]